MEEFVIDSAEWDRVSASLYLTKRGEVYVVAVEAGAAGTPPSPATVRLGGDSDPAGSGSTQAVAGSASATVTNPDVPARLTLSGLSPERGYLLYAYGENSVGGRRGAGFRGDGDGHGGDATTSGVFSMEPAPSGMSAALVAATRLEARTEREPDEELDVPWKDLSESEQMAEALAALTDPVVARAAREAALDPPTAEDLAPGRCAASPVSRNKWRSFCRWWATAVGSNGGGAAGGGGTERSAFLLRECVFAAQQPEVGEADWISRMGRRGGRDKCALAVCQEHFVERPTFGTKD